MKALTLAQVLRLHLQLLERFGGVAGVRDLGALEDALGHPLESSWWAGRYGDGRGGGDHDADYLQLTVQRGAMLPRLSEVLGGDGSRANPPERPGVII